MNHSLPHILIAEREFLIALDAEYLIKAALNCRTTLLRPEQLDQWDTAALADVDLCLLDIPLDATLITERIERLVAKGVPLLFTTVGDIHRDGVEGFEVIPVVMKPHDAETLVVNVRKRLRPRPQPSQETDQN
ncbi:hypothetical protein [Shinella sp. JR1-6]|uniref:hypothetical protein n=1 Tax=Shinella sp. JR1-6 TaxID=2527671 RepID=UPI00102D3AEA|nr:hypothetical protein [Shinella sp. JR1-6]TAA57493.1 hypothetical protein EXZ48_20510 [Shinella sp. JR1-6]